MHIKGPKPTSKLNTSLFVFFMIAALEALFGLVYLASIPSDPKNSIFGGYSLERLLLMLIMITGIIIPGVLAYFSRRKEPRLIEVISSGLSNPLIVRVFVTFSLFFFLAAWLSIFLPDYRFGQFEPYQARLQPIIVWLGLLGLQSITLILYTKQTIKIKLIGEFYRQNRRFFFVVGIFFSLFLLILFGFVLSGISSNPDEVHFNLPGVPLLGLQLLGVWIGIFLIGAFIRSNSRVRKNSFLQPLVSSKHSGWKDLLVSAAIWLFAFLLWSNTPFPGSYFAPGPYPPNDVIYPFSDAAGYDVHAQFALIGQGWNNRIYMDKPLYSAFLLVLHLFADQNFDLLVTLQVAVLALMPVLLYWLGFKLHSRMAGVMIASFQILKESNAISSSRLLLNTNSRLLMTEVPTALILIVFTFLFLYWASKKGQNPVFLYISAGILGLATLMRHNTWFVLPFAGLLILLVYWRSWKAWLSSGLIFMTIFVITISPWMVYTSQVEYTPLYFLVPFRGSILKERYYSIEPTKTPDPAQQETMSGSGETAVENSNQQEEIQETPTPLPKADQREQEQNLKSLRRFRHLFSFFPSHIENNLKSSLLILPVQWTYHDLRTTIQSENSFWSRDWDGYFSPDESILFGFNLFMISIGMAYAWRRWKWAGILPVFVYIGYILANAIARTSGGRYIIPIEWVIFLYFGIGLVEVTGWVTNVFTLGAPGDILAENKPGQDKSAVSNGKHSWKTILIVAALFFAATTILALSENFFPRQFDGITEDEEKILVTEAGFNQETILAFLDNEDAVMIEGRSLYPRFYPMGQGEPDKYSPYSILEYPRLAFTLIGPRDDRGVILPINEAPDQFPHGEGVLVLGCMNERTIQAVAVYVPGGDTQFFIRSPLPPLTCPIPEPVCDLNRNCQ